MVAVVPAGRVPLRAEALDPEVGPVALEGFGAGLDAADGVGARDEGDLGVADGGVAVGSFAVVGDC